MEPSFPRTANPKTNGHPWIKCPQARTEPRRRLVCFPHAGGTASVYHRWGAMASHETEVWAIELPGHGTRFGEAPAQHLVTTAQTIAAALGEAGLLDLPFALFGHSMGGLLAFEVARAFRRSPQLQHLFASGCHMPQLDHGEPPIHALPPDDFLAVLTKRYGGIPDEILQEKELVALLLPALRADMMMVECHRHQPGPALACPITALAGLDDARATPEVLAGWRPHTAGPFELLRFPGGHFYLQTQGRELVATLEARLHAIPAAKPPGASA